MPTTRKQQRAACAEYGRRKRGKSGRNFKSMSKGKLRSWCKTKKLHKR